MRFDFILDRLTPGADYDFKRVDGERIYDDYSKIIWQSEEKMPTIEACQVEWDVMQVEETNEGIDEKRVEAYGSIGDQLDMMYHDLVDGTTTWVEHITAVKLEYPKDN